MAWIKFETSTSNKPEVWQMAGILGIDPDAVVGKLLKVWAWFDEQTENGNAPSVTKVLLDRHVSNDGFVTAMLQVGWMTEDENGISIPNFTRHNGDTAKKRVLTAKRVAEQREKKATVTPEKQKSNARSVTSALPKEEKRREEKIREEKEELNTSCSEPHADSKPKRVDEPLYDLEFKTTGKQRIWKPPQSLVDKLTETYETIDVPFQLRAASMWCETNPQKRKTADGMPRMLDAWLRREVNNPRAPKKRPPPQPGEFVF